MSFTPFNYSPLPDVDSVDWQRTLIAALDENLLAIERSISSGTSIDHFQAQDDGTTGQLTTASAVDLSGMWATPDHTGQGFSWSNGVLTVSAASEVVEFDVAVHGWNNAANRVELHVLLLEDSGSGYTAVKEASQYMSRDNTQDEGNVTIPGYKRFNVAAGTKYKLQVLHVGVAVTVGHSNVAGQTYISAKRYS